MANESQIEVIDSHTAGEPTRVVINGGPTPPDQGALAARDFLKEEADWLRRMTIHEPRGFDAMVGAFLCEPSDDSCVSGVVFFNNDGYLGGCIHGTIGVVTTLAYQGKISTGCHSLETPVGVITIELHQDGRVTVTNVPSYRLQKAVAISVPDYGLVEGDIAWGGNWFFLIHGSGPTVAQKNIEALTNFTWAVRQALDASMVRGHDGALVDHIEVYGQPEKGVQADSQNFVLCPGKAYDRSPCGTGFSAKLACLAADHELAEGTHWVQAGILGTSFEGHFQHSVDGNIIPTITGKAFITAKTHLLSFPDDPYRFGSSRNER